MANTFKFGNGKWATGEGTVLAYNDENKNFKPLPFDFTRASTATYVDSDGLIKTAGNGEPRIGYKDNTDGALLLEPSRSNLNTLSDPTDAQKFSTSYASVTFQDDFNWALGSLLENAIVFGDNSTTRYSYYSNTVSSGTVYSLSFFIKMDDNSIPIPATDFLLVLAGTSIASGYNIDDYGNNVYRVSVTGTAGASNTANGVLKVASHSAKTFKITGFQIEAGSYPTSYIPTSGSAVTRVGENAYQKNVNQVIGQSEGTMFIDFIPKSKDDFQILYQIRTTGNSNVGQIDVRLQSGNIRVLGNDDGGSQQFSITGTYFDVGVRYKCAVRYKENDVAFYINGVLIGTDLSASFSSSFKDQVSFGENLTSLLPIANIIDARLYNNGLSNAELQALTQ